MYYLTAVGSLILVKDREWLHEIIALIQYDYFNSLTNNTEKRLIDVKRNIRIGYFSAAAEHISE